MSLHKDEHYLRNMEMTLSQSFSRFGAFAAAAVVTAGILAIPATPVQAKGAGYYTIELSQPATAKEAIIRGVMVKCEGTTCRAPITGSAPRNVCASVAKEFGEIVAFKAGDRVLDAADISTCNAKKKINIAKD
jgi:hypothetical protein